MNTKRLAFVSLLVKLLPETRAFGLKRRLYAWAGAQLGAGVRICSSATLLGGGRLQIGEGTWIGHQALIVTGSNIQIGSHVDIGPRVYIGTGTHARGTGHKAAGEGLNRDVAIGDGAWLGAGALILPGITLGPRTTVGAASVLTRDTREGVVMVGNPAQERTTAARGGDLSIRAERLP